MFDQALRYWFIIALVMIILVYYVADVQIIKAGAPAAVSLDYAITGRTSSGQYPQYPTNPPKIN